MQRAAQAGRHAAHLAVELLERSACARGREGHEPQPLRRPERSYDVLLLCVVGAQVAEHARGPPGEGEGEGWGEGEG